MLVSAQWLQRAVILAREIAAVQETISAAQRALFCEPRRRASPALQVPSQQPTITSTPPSCSYDERLAGLADSEWGPRRPAAPRPKVARQLLQHLSRSELFVVGGPSRNGNDVCAWLRRFQLARRLAGDDGVLAVLDLLCETRCVPETRGEWAAHFWGGMMQVAVKTPGSLKKAIGHALWMADVHDVLWPDLYATVMPFLLASRRFAWAQKCHLLFVDSVPEARRYLPDAATLSAVLQRFVLDPSRAMQHTLRLVYCRQPHRTMYDELIPLAYGQGTTLLARWWRRLLVQNGDLPVPNTSSPSRPFILFMDAFLPNTVLAEAEHAVLSQEPPPQASRTDTQPPMPSSLLSWSLLALREERGPATDSSLELHYADMFAATRSFSLENMVRMIRHDGVDELRPLVIQTLARRERDAPAIARAIRLFADAGISLGASAYGRIVQELADAGKTAHIAALLSSDIHPDVYDDHNTILRILRQRAAASDLEGYRHLLTVVLAAGRRSTHAIMNDILGGAAGRSMGRVAAVLDDMAALGVPVSHEAASLLFQGSINTLAPSWRSEIRLPDHAFVAALLRVARTLYRMGRPIPSNRWRHMIYSLGQRGRIEHVEAMCFCLVDQYRQQRRRRCWIPVAGKDVPPPAHVSRSPEELLLLPSDLSASHAMYPLKRIFTPPLVRAIVRWGFTQPLRKPVPYDTTLGKRRSIADFDIGRGVRLMHELQKRRVHVLNIVPIIRNTLMFRFASLQLGRNMVLPSRIGKATCLDYLRSLLDDAHGSTLLPQGPGLQGKVDQLAMKRDMSEDARAPSKASRQRHRWNHKRFILSSMARRRMGRGTAATTWTRH